MSLLDYISGLYSQITIHKFVVVKDTSSGHLELELIDIIMQHLDWDYDGHITVAP